MSHTVLCKRLMGEPEAKKQEDLGVGKSKDVPVHP